MSTQRWQISNSPSVEVGEFSAKAPESGLGVFLKLESEDSVSGGEKASPRWRLGLRVTPDPGSCSPEGAAELSSRIEEFFRRRVSALNPIYSVHLSDKPCISIRL